MLRVVMQVGQFHGLDDQTNAATYFPLNSSTSRRSIPHTAGPRLDAANPSSMTVPRLDVASRTNTVVPRLDTSIRTRTAVPRLDASIPLRWAVPRLDAPNTSSLTVPRLDVASRTKVAPRLDTSTRTRTAVPRLDAGIHHSGVVPRLEAPCETRQTDPRLDVRSQTQARCSRTADWQLQENSARAVPRLDAQNRTLLAVRRVVSGSARWPPSGGSRGNQESEQIALWHSTKTTLGKDDLQQPERERRLYQLAEICTNMMKIRGGRGGEVARSLGGVLVKPPVDPSEIKQHFGTLKGLPQINELLTIIAGGVPVIARTSTADRSRHRTSIRKSP